MRGMELKVWVDGVQRIVCGVTEVTTCQEVVIALAQAIGRTGRYTLIEKWRETERHLAPHENPVVSLNKWGQYASDVQLVLQRTGPSLSERPTSDTSARAPERSLYRQSLPPMAKLRPTANDRSLKRREPKRKSLTFTGGAKGLRDIFGKNREGETKQRTVNTNRSSTPAELSCLVQLQKDKLCILEQKLQCCETELQQQLTEEEEEELVKLEQQVRRNEAEMKEHEFWENELKIEQDNERQLREQLQELRSRVQECEEQLGEYLARIQCMEAGLEAECLQQELMETQLADEMEVRSRLDKACAELDMQVQQAARLESSCRAVELSLGQSNIRLQERQQELEQLTKELRQVNLQQFIQQTGTKVTVLPADPGEEEANTESENQSGSLKRLGSARQLPAELRALQRPLNTTFNPEGIYV
ncbi:ras association domain-containing protein 8b [Sinocyclocheilus anshuiensis]|uniref:Ras-associating domain-containing protein n=1 Tax=Sinocyclocheilus anshuiensis TaxID=1608454 RepID=A0A671SKE0_9TELE|nr:PREDICTED: ras association domain-containing protein 8 [Sinocyclocheilus anshuiensis]XP_016355689.1 PREDICTED: ras association domain-containing protein 8 [Sinocyclocheilus anshuiensis]